MKTSRLFWICCAGIALPGLTALSACGDDDGACAVAGLPGATAGQPCDDDVDCAPVSGQLAYN